MASCLFYHYLEVLMSTKVAWMDHHRLVLC